MDCPFCRDHKSNSSYVWDNYNWDVKDPADPENPDGWVHLHAGHPCYDPNKDLVIPSLKPPDHYKWSPLAGAPDQPKKHLLYFRGDVGKHRKPNYSRGIRQRLYNLTVTRGWTARYNISIGDRGDLPGDYSQGLASSKFCLVAPGDGFSARAEDSILHGCIPFVIMDQVHQPLQSLLPWHQYSVRVPESKMDQVPEILLSIPEKHVEQLAARVRKVMHRFMYLSHPWLKHEFLALRKSWAAKRAAAGEDAGQGWDTGLAAHGNDIGEEEEGLQHYWAFAIAGQGEKALLSKAKVASLGNGTETTLAAGVASATLGSGGGSLTATGGSGGIDATGQGLLNGTLLNGVNDMTVTAGAGAGGGDSTAQPGQGLGTANSTAAAGASGVTLQGEGLGSIEGHKLSAAYGIHGQDGGLVGGEIMPGLIVPTPILRTDVGGWGDWNEEIYRSIEEEGEGARKLKGERHDHHSNVESGAKGLPRHIFEDDMFGTILQWLYVKMLDGYD